MKNSVTGPDELSEGGFGKAHVAKELDPSSSVSSAISASRSPQTITTGDPSAAAASATRGIKRRSFSSFSLTLAT